MSPETPVPNTSLAAFFANCFPDRCPAAVQALHFEFPSCRRVQVRGCPDITVSTIVILALVRVSIVKSLRGLEGLQADRIASWRGCLQRSLPVAEKQASKFKTRVCHRFGARDFVGFDRRAPEGFSETNEYPFLGGDIALRAFDNGASVP